MAQEITAPGLKWRERKGGAVPIWVASPGAVAAGFTPKTVALKHLMPRLEDVAAACYRLDTEMRRFINGERQAGRIGFNGTLRSLIEVYQTHEQSKYHALAPGSLHTYNSYLPRLSRDHGHRQIESLSGLDVAQWFAQWRRHPSGRDTLAAARAALAILKSVLSFGIAAKFKGCRDLAESIGGIRFESLQPRNSRPTFQQVASHMEKAHAEGYPSMALADAIQFETAVRQWDVIGQWVPLSDPRPSAIIFRDKKWIGPQWSDIDENLIWRVRPSKTLRSTGAVVEFDLKEFPLVMQEINRIPVEKRRGPLIALANGQPWSNVHYTAMWRKVARLAGLPDGMWSRDMRAGGISEGRAAAASRDDLSKMAGHSSQLMTAKVYDRETLETTRRVAQARTLHRAKTKPGT